MTGVEVKVQSLTVDQFGTPEEFRDYFKCTYGPTIAVYRFIDDDAERVAALGRGLADLARRFGLDNGSTTFEWEPAPDRRRTT